MMDRTVVRKTSLREADNATCAGMSTDGCLAVLAELNRVGLAALGVDDRPLQRSALHKFSFREFAVHVPHDVPNSTTTPR
ncbi:MAG: hypothetical protein IJ783_11635 [Kiritimatiellae bacterium]|nr:hypothetical protein [Kiritimatiellia bacterium]